MLLMIVCAFVKLCSSVISFPLVFGFEEKNVLRRRLLGHEARAQRWPLLLLASWNT
jgi:hypothetical protein